MSIMYCDKPSEFKCDDCVDEDYNKLDSPEGK